MKDLIFFIKQIFLKRWILVLGMLLIIFLANYLTFTASRSLISTYQGNQENKILDQDGLFISNLDPDVEQNFDAITIEETQKVYDYLESHYEYAIDTYGFVADIPNTEDMEVSVRYINEQAYDLRDIKLSEGKQITFQDLNTVKPVLIGAGLAKEYPVGSVIEMIDPVTHQPTKLKVNGILEKNASRSNIYALNSKNYLNYSIYSPIDEEFIKQSSLDLHVNVLNDLILLNSSEKEVNDLKDLIQSTTGLTFNFFSQKENDKFFKDYYMNGLQIISMLTLICFIIATGLAIWNTLISIRLMIKDFTVHLLVGLSYPRLRSILYQYFGIVFFISFSLLTIFVSVNRYSAWYRKDAIFATLGILKLIGMDWMALIIVLLIDMIMGIFIVEFMMRKIKKIPISLGVLT